MQFLGLVILPVLTASLQIGIYFTWYLHLTFSLWNNSGLLKSTNQHQKLPISLYQLTPKTRSLCHSPSASRVPHSMQLSCFLSLLYIGPFLSHSLSCVFLVLLRRTGQWHCSLPNFPYDWILVVQFEWDYIFPQKMLCPLFYSFHQNYRLFNLGVGEDGFVLGSVGEWKNRWHICGKELMHSVFKWGVKVPVDLLTWGWAPGFWQIKIATQKRCKARRETVLLFVSGKFVFSFIVSMHFLFISLKSVSSLRTKLIVILTIACMPSIKYITGLFSCQLFPFQKRDLELTLWYWRKVTRVDILVLFWS